MLPVLDMCYALFIDDCGVFVCLGMRGGCVCDCLGQYQEGVSDPLLAESMRCCGDSQPPSAFALSWPCVTVHGGASAT